MGKYWERRQRREKSSGQETGSRRRGAVGEKVAAKATWTEREEAHHWTGAHLRRENGGPNDTQCTHHTTLLVLLVLTPLNVHEN